MNHPFRKRDAEIVEIVLNNIQGICDAKGLTMSHVLDAAGINVGYISNIKSSKSQAPTITKLQRIADALGEPLTTLILSGDRMSARNRLLRIADMLEPHQLELLESMAQTLAGQRGNKR